MAERDRELARQIFHMAVGIIALAVLLVLGRGFAMAAVFFTIIIGMMLINSRMLGRNIGLVQWFEERFEREDAPLPGWGSAAYATGALLAITFLSDISQIAAVILILGIGDGLSTIVGRRGRIRIPYNSKKTLEGALALFASSLASYYFVGPIALPLAFIAMIAESLPIVDDNISIPVACTAFFLIFT